MADEKIKVLLIEDSRADARIIRGMLLDSKDDGFQLNHAKTLSGALDIIQKTRVDIIVCDLGLPDCYGLETFTILQSRFKHIPIVVLTGMDDETLAVEAVKKGAQDYLVKGNVDGNSLRQSLRYAIERKQIELKLQSQTELLNNIISHIPHNIFWKDRDSVYLGCNENFAKLAGVNCADEIAGKTDHDLNCRLKDADYYISCDQTVMQHNKPMLNIEDTHAEANGAYTTYLTSKVPLRDANGKIVGLLGIFSDITARKKAEDALKESKERYRRITDSITDYIFTVYLENGRPVRTVHSNTSVAVTGYSPEEFYADDQLWIKMVYPEDRRAVTEHAKKCIACCKLGPLEHRIIRKDGTIRWVKNTMVRQYDLEGNLLSYDGLIQDIDEMKRAEQQLRQSKEQAETARAQIEKANVQLKETYNELMQTSRQAGMAEVASDVLHNVGNVLNSVNVLAAFIKERIVKSEIPNLKSISKMIDQNIDNLTEFLTEDEKGKHVPAYLAQVANHMSKEHKQITKKLNSLVNNINHIKEIVKTQQMYSKASGVEIITTVEDIIEDAIEINESGLLKRKVDIIRDFCDLGFVSMDKQRVLQILVNLITNSQHALDESGEKEKNMTVKSYKTSNNMVGIQVIDNGIGIAKENLTKVFQHGFTTKKHGNGFGLHSGALAAKEMGGELTAASPGKGKGAVFTLLLPLNRVETMQCN